MIELGTVASVVLAVVSLLLAGQAAYSAALMLYAWEDEDKWSQNRVPATFEPPRNRFTVLLPARHEEAVIQGTIQRVVDLDYPRELVEVLVVIEAGDHGTIAKVLETMAMLRAQGIDHVRLLTFDDPPINKPHGLNVGLSVATGSVVTIFDAEDEPHPEILQVVNTLMVREGAPVVQCGVQLMNYADRWFSASNVLEYFFWFKSRMHYHAAQEIVLLGGNTVFIRRELLDKIGGWDQHCLTEDADVGIRLSAMGVPIRVLYDDDYVTREETPPTVDQLVRQRTRWDQGFLQVLGKGDWLRLRGWRQRLLALYSLSSPLLQGITVLYLPVSIWTMLYASVPIPVAMISSLPLYMVTLQYLVSVAGLYEFARVHHLKPSRWSALQLLAAFMPYQWLLGFSALRAVWRQVGGNNSWEKTVHTGALRRGPQAPLAYAPLAEPVAEPLAKQVGG
ncbi:MAG: glycosyltransferase XagB [Chloroflexota bacterium]|jgi:cellulose synthase/poly-beta-1,6-N-acetylglucosamine synthase-like glycosyltransferase|nr:glycosyltransferase XagB [Chloroflexota bacterium]